MDFGDTARIRVIVTVVAAVYQDRKYTFDSLIYLVSLWGIGVELLEIGMQTAGLGATIARNYFVVKPGAALCCALYTFGCMFTGILVAQSFRLADYRRAKRTENAVAPPAPPQKNGEPRDQES